MPSDFEKWSTVPVPPEGGSQEGLAPQKTPKTMAEWEAALKENSIPGMENKKAKELVIDESYIHSVQSYLMTQCETLNSLITNYVKIMREVVETGIMEGDTAEALKAFLESVDSDVVRGNGSLTPEQIRNRIDQFVSNYLSRINGADKELY